MESIEERLKKSRQERIAREKARIDKLRELNLKKYNKNETQSIPKAPSIVSLANKTLTSDIKPKKDLKNVKTTINHVKNNFSMNGTSKRPLSVPMLSKKPITIQKTKPVTKNGNVKTTEVNNDQKMAAKALPVDNTKKKDFINSNKIIAKYVNKHPVNAKNGSDVARKSLALIKITNHTNLPENQSTLSAKPIESRKSMLPVRPMSVTKNRESVFDRLYKPKMVQKSELSDADRLQRDPIFLHKVLQQGSLIANKRHTIAPNFAKPMSREPVRRSISAVHLKRISRKELGSCFQKWSSIGEKINEIHITNTNEDHNVKQDTITSAIKSERKRVRLQTPTYTPRPEELQHRLQKWLQSRGKSLDSYQHLQCFGVHLRVPLKPLFLKPETFDDENKENIALDHDSDNDSYTDNINDRNDEFDKNKWRGRVSHASDSVCMNDSHDTTLNSEEPVDDVLLGALNDLTELLREGFDWEQCARWLRAIRVRFPQAPALAAYWECRAALEETRGDLPASVQCWEEAIAKGTQHSVVDANLDQLLDKFMQLKISPNSGKRERVDPKLVDVKNVFKSTIIRFAVQQAKLRQSNQSEQPTHTMTPVRRSGRLSARWTRAAHNQKTPKTPLQICSSIRQAGLIGEKLQDMNRKKYRDTENTFIYAKPNSSLNISNDKSPVKNLYKRGLIVKDVNSQVKRPRGLNVSAPVNSNASSSNHLSPNRSMHSTTEQNS